MNERIKRSVEQPWYYELAKANGPRWLANIPNSARAVCEAAIQETGAMLEILPGATGADGKPIPGHCSIHYTLGRRDATDFWAAVRRLEVPRYWGLFRLIPEPPKIDIGYLNF